MKDKPEVGSAILGLVKNMQGPVAEYIRAIIELVPVKLVLGGADDEKFWGDLLPFFKKLRYEKPNILRRINIASQLCAFDRQNITIFVGFFPGISMNMSCPACSEKALENSVFAKVPDVSKSLLCRMTICYVSCELLTEFFLRLLDAFDERGLDRDSIIIYKHAYQQMIFSFLRDSSQENIVILKQVFWKKWALIFNRVSKVIPESVLGDLIRAMQRPFVEESFLRTFILKSFSAIHYPEFKEPTCQFFIKFLSSTNCTSKGDVSNIMALMKFLRNLLGFAIPSKTAAGLVQEIRKFIGRIPRSHEKLCFGSTLVLFHTMGTQGEDIKMIYEGGTSKYKYIGVLRAFSAIFNGEHYIPECEITKDVVKEWKPREFDQGFIPVMLRFVMDNMQKFGECQEDLAHFFIRCYQYDGKWFLTKEFIPSLAQGDFATYNRQAILTFAEYVITCGNCGAPENELLGPVQAIAQTVFGSNKNISGNSLGYVTTESDNDDFLVENTIVLPVMVSKQEAGLDVDLDKWSKITGNTLNLNVCFARAVGTDELVGCVSSPDYSVTPLKRAISIFPFFPPSDQMMNFVVLYLFSSDPVVSAITLRSLEKYTTKHPNFTALDSLLTLIPKTVNEWYLLTYAAYRLVKRCQKMKLSLDYQHACILFTWNLVFLASPHPNTRAVAIQLAKTTGELIGDKEHWPNLALFLQQNSTNISRRALSHLITVFSMESDYELSNLVDFERIAVASYGPLYHIFFSAMLSYLTYYIDRFVDLRDLVNAQSISIIYANTGWSSLGMIFLITIHVALCGSDSTTMATILASGLKAALDSGPIFFLTLFSSVNPELPCHAAKQLLLIKEGVHAHALALSVRIRMSIKNCEKEMNEIESILKKIVDYLTDSHIVSDKCDGIVDQAFFENVQWQFAVCDLMKCIEQFSKELFERHKEQRRGTLLRINMVGKDLRNPFDSTKWFTFMYNMSSLPQLHYQSLNIAVAHACVAYLRVVRIPKAFKEPLRQSLSDFATAKLIDYILCSSFNFFLPAFIEEAIQVTAFFEAIADQFLDPVDVETDLTKLKRILHRNKSHQCFMDHLGSLVALSLFYATDESQRMKSLSFKMFYHLSLFAFIASNQVPTGAIEHLDDLRSHYLSSSCQVPNDLLLKISSDFASYFPFAAQQFVKMTFAILSTARNSGSFLLLVPPWFSLVPCDPEMLLELENATYKFGVEKRLSQFPIPVEALPLIHAVVGQNPLYVMNQLFTMDPDKSKCLCVFLCLQYGDDILPFLIDHLKFDYWLFDKKSYDSTIRLSYSVMYRLIRENYSIVQPFLHYLYCHCYSYRDVEKQAPLLLASINEKEFSRRQQQEIANEAFRWAVSCGDSVIAINCCQLVMRFEKEGHSESKCRMLLNTISSMVSLLHESRAQVISHEICHISSLLELAHLFNPSDNRLKSFVLELLKCNKGYLNNLFVAALTVLDSLLKTSTDWSPEVLHEIVILIISAEYLNAFALQKALDTLITISEIAVQPLKLDILKAVFVPVAHVKQRNSFTIFTETELQEISSNPWPSVKELLRGLEPETLYFILRFYVTLATLNQSPYKDVICEICCQMLKVFPRVAPVTCAVFQPLVSLILRLPDMTDADVEFITVLSKRPKPKPLPTETEIAFPQLKIELQINEVPWIPIDKQFFANQVYSSLERTLSSVPTPSLMRKKQTLAKYVEKRTHVEPPFNYTDILIRIDMLLNKRKVERSRKSVSSGDVFAFQVIDRSVFTPSIDDANMIGDKSDVFPRLGI